uniref:Uncharacterized protein n=2 Tax=Eutreptiella gymnastica TaxID=73025 RepID=A0A7S4D0D5_9EUGL
MPKDPSAAPSTERAQAVVRRQGRKVTTARLRQRASTPQYFADHIRGINAATAAVMHTALAPHVDSNGYLIKDPRHDRGVALKAVLNSVPKEVSATFPDDNLKQAVLEELNVMWALHEMSGEHFDKFLQVVINNL